VQANGRPRQFPGTSNPTEPAKNPSQPRERDRSPAHGSHTDHPDRRTAAPPGQPRVRRAIRRVGARLL